MLPASNDERCYACDRKPSHGSMLTWAVTVDGQRVYVGRECYRKIVAADPTPYQPRLGGPALVTPYRYFLLQRGSAQ